MPRPLEHIRVLDLTRVLAGPWATQNLADLGAEVIKIERPGSGDETRSWGPPWLRDEGGADGDAAYYLSVNRGKKSVAVDLAHPAGRRLVRDLAACSDVLVENFKVGDLARFGLGFPDVRAVHPGIVYCSITGFGQTGPYAERPGYDFVFQGMSGLMSITGERDDLPGGGPQKTGVAVTDIFAGMYASLAIVAALAHRERTGQGQHIDLSLFDAALALGASPILNYRCSGAAPRRHGNAHPNIVPYQVFATADGEMVLAVGNDAQFAAFCRAAGRAELAADPRFATNPERVRHRAALAYLVEEIVSQRPTGEWIAALTAAGVPCGPIHGYDRVLEDEQVRHRGIEVSIPREGGVPCPSVASPMRFSETPVEYRTPPPRLGEHTGEVLERVLGMSAGEIEALARERVI